MIHPVWLHNQASSQNTPNSRMRNSQFSTGAVVWLPGATLATLSDSLHTVFSHVRSSCALAFAQTSCFLELPYQRRMSPRWINSVTSTKLTLHSDYRITPRNGQHTKILLLYCRHFLAVICRGATATVEPSRGEILKLRTLLFHLEEPR
jgi:hypothetical protein